MTISPPIPDLPEAVLAKAYCLLLIDLPAVVSNYNLLRSLSQAPETAAVVKANAYGLGIAEVAPVLWRAGARTFFVAQIDEAIALRRALPADSKDAVIYVLNGLSPGSEAVFNEERLRPVLNHLGEVDTWSKFNQTQDLQLPAALHFDTGMNRLGLPETELEHLLDGPDHLSGVGLSLLMSHLACGDEPDNPMNQDQLQRFSRACQRLPGTPASLANSAGHFLGPEYHFNLGRPGVAIFGVQPINEGPKKLSQTISLKGKILQTRQIDADQSVGYGGAYKASRQMRIATVGAGYADGYLRCLTDSGTAFIGQWEVPLVGRVSMDLITLDVSAVPENLSQPGCWVDLIAPDVGVERLANEAGTIGYEILVALSQRYQRHYLPVTT